jgi:DNA-binding MarR family transcriptional regulator
MDKSFQITPHRAKILTRLLAGAIEDPSGFATPILQEHTGHRTSNALAAVLLQLEGAGLVTRDMNGRRTYRIALTKEGERVARGLTDQPAPATAAQAVVEGAVDLDLLAGVMLKLGEELSELREQVKSLEASNQALTEQLGKVTSASSQPTRGLISKREKLELEKLLRGKPVR